MIQTYRLIFLILVSFNGISQNQSTNPKLLESFNNGDFETCINDCNHVLNQDDKNAQANLLKGASLIRIKKYAEAEDYLAKARANSFQPETLVNTNMLLMHAGLKQTKEVLTLLKTMIDKGFSSLILFNAEEFNYLKDNQDFIQLKTKVDANANPCKYGEDYKKLDFWLGDWDVYVNGKKSADSFITKSIGGCTLHEDYRTLGGYFGTSYNYYDASDKLYTQIWIDQLNGKIEFKEIEAREGYLLLLANQGEGNLVRMSYEKDPKTGDVTQIMENSSDSGETWNLSFSGVYKKKKTN